MFPINTVVAEALKVQRKRKKDCRGGLVAPSISLDPVVFQKVKEAIANADAQQKHLMLEELQRQLYLELDSPSGATRLKSLALIDYLFLRSYVFRTLVCKDLRTIVSCSQSPGFPFARPRIKAPKDYQVEVGDASLRMIEKWYI